MKKYMLFAAFMLATGVLMAQTKPAAKDTAKSKTTKIGTAQTHSVTPGKVTSAPHKTVVVKSKVVKNTVAPRPATKPVPVTAKPAAAKTPTVTPVKK